jgi:hypothetical protein
MDGIPMAGREISLCLEDTSGFRNFSFYFAARRQRGATRILCAKRHSMGHGVGMI